MSGYLERIVAGLALADARRREILQRHQAEARANGAIAGRAVFDAGGSPRAQLDAMRAATGEQIALPPHDGLAARARRRRQAAKIAAKS